MRACPVLATGGAVAGGLASPAVAIRTRSDGGFSMRCGFAAGSFGGATGTGIVQGHVYISLHSHAALLYPSIGN